MQVFLCCINKPFVILDLVFCITMLAQMLGRKKLQGKEAFGSRLLFFMESAVATARPDFFRGSVDGSVFMAAVGIDCRRTGLSQ